MTTPREPDEPQDVIRPDQGRPSLQGETPEPLPVIGPDGIERAPERALEHRPDLDPERRGDRGGAPAVPPESTLVAVFGDCRRAGGWHVAPRPVAVSVFGDVVLDLREAVLPDVEVIDVRACTVFGDVKILVPPGVDVHVRGFQIFGDNKDRTTRGGIVTGPRRTLVVNGYGAFGDVTVRTLEPGETEPSPWQAWKAHRRARKRR